MYDKRIQNFVLPAGAGIVLILLLQLQVIHRIFGISLLQLPLPSSVIAAFLDSFGKIIQNGWATLLPALAGMIAGAAAGYLVAAFATVFRTGGYGALFIMTLVNSVPIVALAPLMNRWFEIPFTAKFAVIAVASSGAMAVNAFHGMNDIEDNALQMMKMTAATGRQILFKLRMPASLPNVFTGFKVIVPVGMLAAIISEYFSGKTEGLGYMIKYCLKVGNMKQTGWAYILAAAVLSLIIYAAVCALETRFTGWHVSQRTK